MARRWAEIASADTVATVQAAEQNHLSAGSLLALAYPGDSVLYAKQAKELGVTILDEAEFEELIRRSS